MMITFDEINRAEIQKRHLIKNNSYTKRDLENLLDSIPFSIWLKDNQGNYMFVNERFIEEIKEDYKINDNSIDSYSSLNYAAKEYWSKENDNYIKQIDKYILENKNFVLEEEVLNINGVERWYESFRSCIQDSEGEYKNIAGIAREITEYKKMDEKFTRGHWLFSDVSNIFKKDETEINELLNDISNEVMKRLKGTATEFWIVDKEQNLIKPAFNSIYTKTILEKTNVSGIDNNMLRLEANLYKENTIIDLRLENNRYNSDALVDMGLRYAGIYSIEFKSEVLGFFTVGFTEENKPKYKEDEFVKSICNQFGVLINNYNLRKDLKKEFEKRKEAERELEQLLDTAADLIAIIDEKGGFLKLNERWTAILGWSREELLCIKARDIIHYEDIQYLEECLGNLKIDNCRKELVTRCLCKNSEYKWIKWSVKLDSVNLQYITTGKDITEEKAMEQHRKVYEEVLQLETIKNEFFSNISHEFKTPLNIIISAMQLINSHIDNKRISVEAGVDLNKYIKAINHNSYRLLRLVNNLIDMTKIDIGYYDINVENYNIVSVIEDVTMSVASYVKNKGIELIFDTEIEELTVACDIEKVERIMLNLLSNAIKHLKENGKIEVTLKVKKDHNDKKNDKDNGYGAGFEVKVSNKKEHQKEQWVEISVKDNGDGISKYKLPAIFERFIQVDEILARRSEGSGIGLSLVKSLVEMHKGEIWVKSEEGVGSEFIFNLPIVTVKDKQNNIEKARIDSVKTSIEKCQIEFSDIYDLI